MVDENSRSSLETASIHRECTFIISSEGLIALLQTATALGKLGHPDGELNLTKAAAKHGVIQMVRLLVRATRHLR